MCNGNFITGPYWNVGFKVLLPNLHTVKILMTDNSAQGPTFKDVRNFDSTKCQMFTTYDTKQKNFTKISSRIRIYFLVPVATNY